MQVSLPFCACVHSLSHILQTLFTPALKPVFDLLMVPLPLTPMNSKYFSYFSCWGQAFHTTTYCTFLFYLVCIISCIILVSTLSIYLLFLLSHTIITSEMTSSFIPGSIEGSCMMAPVVQQSVLPQLQQSHPIVIPVCHTLLVCYGLFSLSVRYPLVSPDDPKVSKPRSWPHDSRKTLYSFPPR